MPSPVGNFVERALCRHPPTCAGCVPDGAGGGNRGRSHRRPEPGDRRGYRAGVTPLPPSGKSFLGFARERPLSFVDRLPYPDGVISLNLFLLPGAQVRATTVPEVHAAIAAAQLAQPAWALTPLAERVGLLKAACRKLHAGISPGRRTRLLHETLNPPLSLACRPGGDREGGHAGDGQGTG